MRLALKLFAILALLVLGGFFAFVGLLPREETFELDAALAELDDIPPSRIGIVAFTGGNGERITKAIRLYARGNGDRVLVSGTHPLVRKPDLFPIGDAGIFDCCVDLGDRARSTVGNAKEARDWARRQGYEGLIIVTSDFHVPRSVSEMAVAAPDIVIVGVPVASELTPTTSWLRQPKAWRTLLREYAKYLFAQVRRLIP